MKNLKKLIVIASIATGLILGGKSVFAQQVVTNQTTKPLLNPIGINSVDDWDGFSPVPIKIQKTLISLGYKISVNGDLSSYDTKLAIKDFQNKNGLIITGEVDIKMLDKLSEK